MKIKYEFVNGDVSEIEVDVPAKITDFYLQSLEQEKSNDRKNSRPDRHTSLEQFNYEDARYFSLTNDFPDEIISGLEVEHILSVLNEKSEISCAQVCFRRDELYRNGAANREERVGCSSCSKKSSEKNQKKFYINRPNFAFPVAYSEGYKKISPSERTD